MIWITSMVWLNWMRLDGKQIPLKIKLRYIAGAFLLKVVSHLCHNYSNFTRINKFNEFNH